MRFFDDVSGMSMAAIMGRLRLVTELANVRKELLEIAQGAAAIMQRLGLIKRANQIRTDLGALAIEVPGASLRLSDEPIEINASPRTRNGGLYEFSEKATRGKRQKANDAAVSLLNQVQSGEIDKDSLTDESRRTLAAYTGNGGALIGADGKKGSAYEYYTPKPIAEGIWDAMRELGFSGGKVLDPCAGTGIFGATAPASAAVDAVELDAVSGGINSLVNDGAGYTTTISPFERVAAATPDEMYDAVVTNVPFGTVADRGGNQTLDPKYQHESLEAYFILRSLDKLKPGGLAAFLVPPRCTSGRDGGDAKLRQRASLKADFLGAFRLPNSVFGSASADTITDVIFFRKYSRAAAEKIAELQEQDPAKLSEANVLWDEYLDGKYFAGDGRRFVLGEFVPKDPNKFRDVDRVTNPASVPDIAKLMRKLPKSRVNWNLLEASETAPIIYAEGDTITQAGQTLQLKDGEWLALAVAATDVNGAVLLGDFADAYAAFRKAKSYDEASVLMQYMRTTSQALDIPGWLASAMSSLDKIEEGARANAWPSVLVGLAVSQVLDEVGRDSGTNFEQDYMLLSESLKAQSVPARRIKGLSGMARVGLGEIANHYNRKTGFSAVWRGDIQSAPITSVAAASGFEGVLYENKSSWATLEQARTVYGADFDPMADDGWAISGDGQQVSRADDYYVGNYGEFCARIDEQMAAAPNDVLRARLMRQKAVAASRLDRVNVSKITFNLFSPYVTIEEKAEFLRRFVHPGAVVLFNDKTSEQEIGFDIPGSNLSDRDKLIRRVGAYLKNGTLTLGGVKLSMKDADAIKELRTLIGTANEQFNGWARGNAAVIGRLEAQVSDPFKLRFTQLEDESPLVIPGMNPDLTLHGYQNAEVRKRSRDFSGINGFDVGLGKTFTALALVQYVQSIGVKKKTAIIVPNSVLSNWRKEAQRAYTGMDDCLFIGLREDGKGGASVSSSNYDEDLNRVLENRHSKIFMTMQAFERIRMKAESIAGYESFMRSADQSFAESEDRKTDERAKGKAKTILDILGDKPGAAPYLEDMGIDSLVVDEAHIFKNSATTVDFKGGKYLSISPAARCGLDAQAKAWLIRGGSDRGDGVMLLTATPITNSPLEIYSMLSLAAGHNRVNDMFAGTSGADGFMNAVCHIENEDDESIDGQTRAVNVFHGLNNADILRQSLSAVATIKSAKDVGGQITVPDSPEQATSISLPSAIVERLNLYKEAYRFAADELSGRSENRGDLDAFEEVSSHFGEPVNLVGHPFNLVRKMSALILDPDLDRRLTRYLTAEGEQDATQKLVDAWNTKGFTEDRDRPGPNATTESALSVKTRRNADGEVVGQTFKIPVRAWIDGPAVAIDTQSPDMQDKFEAMAEAMGVGLDVSLSPKLAALLANVQAEASTPRGIDDSGDKIPYAKQIVFCDAIALHNKVRRLLSKRAGVPAAAIAIIAGQRNNTPEQIMDIQNGFNAAGDDNKYRVIIANEKAEVGINLQKGTQAIHHLTIGWTPDSLIQRNGRGVRQGNQTQKVTIYQYDAGGTFDTAKRSLVASKADWIGSLMSKEGGESIDIKGNISNEQADALIDVIGDVDAVTRIQAAMAAKEAEARATSNRGRQRINLDTIVKQNEFLADNSTAVDWIARRTAALMAAMAASQQVRNRLGNERASESARAKNQALLAELEVKERGIERMIAEASSFYPATYSSAERSYVRKEDSAPIDIRALVLEFLAKAKRGESRGSDLVRSIKDGRVGGLAFVVAVVEDSELVSDWQAEVSTAKSMRDQAIQTYDRQAGQVGGMPSGVAQALSNGEGKIIGDTPVVAGCFIRGKADTYGLAVVSAKSFTGYSSTCSGVWEGAERENFNLPAIVLMGEVVYPGAPEYESCLAQAARMEDGAEREGRTMSLFSSHCPEVASFRETEVLVAYSCYGYQLPAPYYPIVVAQTEGDSELNARIQAEQAKVVQRWEGASFVVSSTLDVQVKDPGLRQVDAMRDYAIANGLQAQLVDLGVAGRFDLERIIKPLVLQQDIQALLDEGGDGDQLRARVATYVQSLVPWVDLEGDVSAYLSFSIQIMIREAAAANNAPGETAAPLVSNASATDLVNVTGKTMEWKDRIKSYALKDGQKAKWNGRQECWAIRRGAWEQLVSDFPRAAEDLELKG